jgi:hypothetical protein
MAANAIGLSLFAVQAADAIALAMMMNLIFALALSAADPAPLQPVPLTPDHLRDIGCVAVLAIIADEQKRGDIRYGQYPAAGMAGRKWAGIVGERVVNQSGQPAELVAFAMREAAANEQAAMMAGANPAAVLEARYTICAPLMRADLEADLASAPLPLPQKQREKRK